MKIGGDWSPEVFVLSDSIRNLVYPASVCVGVGSLWVLAWASHLADRSGYLEAPPLTPQQISERRMWEAPDESAPMSTSMSIRSKPAASAAARAE